MALAEHQIVKAVIQFFHASLQPEVDRVEAPLPLLVHQHQMLRHNLADQEVELDLVLVVFRVALQLLKVTHHL